MQAGERAQSHGAQMHWVLEENIR